MNRRGFLTSATAIVLPFVAKRYTDLPQESKTIDDIIGISDSDAVAVMNARLGLEFPKHLYKNARILHVAKDSGSPIDMVRIDIYGQYRVESYDKATESPLKAFKRAVEAIRPILGAVVDNVTNPHGVWICMSPETTELSWNA